jgi:hypothetical protein
MSSQKVSDIEQMGNEVASFGLTELKMLLMEAVVAKEKAEGKVTDEVYSVFRKVADKHWKRHEKEGAALLCKVNNFKNRRHHK